MIEYKGVKYPTRDLLIKNERGPLNIKIAQESLYAAFGEITCTPTTLDDEADEIDDMIYQYIPDEFWEVSDEEIAKNHLDEEFELWSEDSTVAIIENNEIIEIIIDRKDTTAFTKQIGVCYIAGDDDKSYTYADFLRIAKNNIVIAHMLFQICFWQHIETVFEEGVKGGVWTSEGVIIKQD